MRTLVKVCGITSGEDALVAAEAGADAVGFVFWEGSPRRIDPGAARAIARRLPPSLRRVGVFVDAGWDELQRLGAEIPLDVVQLHGRGPGGRAPDRLPGVWKALPVGPGFSIGEHLPVPPEVSGVLLDTRSDVPGGSGRSFDWDLAREARARVPFLILAGGLHPGNVQSAIARVAPDLVDVSSGVESRPGRKDPTKVRAFVEAVRGLG
jgi:phosphoribosylanthranilate isomerase